MDVILTLYLLMLAVFCIYGVHRCWQIGRYVQLTRRFRSGDQDAPPSACFVDLPPITVQVPLFNEAAVAERIIRAVAALDYPRDRLQIQVLDDSTDRCRDIARRCCDELAAAGLNISYHHRSARDGFKAGALAAGLQQASGRFIAVFDADFVPPADFLLRTVHYFTREQVGMVQTRWSHLNRNQSMLTQIQAMLLDGHFIIEQLVRSRTGKLFNFNGTAGIWRKDAIVDAGGWRHDTLTEDTDLSYRAQLRGWRFVYLTEVQCPAEIPPTFSAMLSQQHRWNKGLMQTAMQLLPRLFTSRELSLGQKIEAWFHLTCPVVYLAVLLLAVLAAATSLVVGDQPLSEALLHVHLAGLLSLVLGTLVAGVFVLVGQSAAGPTAVWRGLLLLLPMFAIGVGLSVVNSRAMIEAWLGRRSPFVRTPKYAGSRRGELDPAVELKPRRLALPRGAVELALATALLATIALAFSTGSALVSLPFLLLFTCGFAVVGVGSLRTA